MRSFTGWWIVIAIILLIDLYIFFAVKFITQNSNDKVRLITYISYWTLTVFSIVVIVLFPYLNVFQTNIVLRNYLFAIMVGLLFAKLIIFVFVLIDDIRRGVVWLMSVLFPQTGVDFVPEEGKISRSLFLSWTGIALGSGLFASLIYGFSNKYDYRVKKVKLAFKNLPAGFKGLKIIHISDIHSGSFTDKAAVNRGVDMILEQKADLILFTGDLVNDRYLEMQDYMDVFGRLQAPMGVYSTLGNHDYGDYVAWESAEEKQANLDELKNVHLKLGWRLMMNENIALEKNGDKIALLGVENWSAFARFPKYGKLDKAYLGTSDFAFKILMSHDPSHWEAQVKPDYADIDLTLSGHTHGMQFGLENPYFKWSPVQWVYKQWAGLYEEGQQKLYVNRGFGFIGYPGRVGILPEITLIELS